MQPHAEMSGGLVCQRVEVLTTAPCRILLDHLGEIWHAAESQQVVIVLDDDGILTPIAPRLQDACRSESMRAVPTSSSYICPVAIVSSRDLKNMWEANTPLGHNVTPLTRQPIRRSRRPTQQL